MNAVKKLFLLLVTALLTACGTTNDSQSNADNAQRPSMDQFGRMPMPTGTKLRTA
jgi:uncharacterized lipoprotein YajG